LSKRQKNRRLQALQKQEEHAIVELSSYRSVAGNANVISCDVHTSTENFAVNSNLDNIANVLGDISTLETQGIVKNPGENFSQNFLYNFSEYLYNFVASSDFAYELEHFSKILRKNLESLHLLSDFFVYLILKYTKISKIFYSIFF
jgi:hypothetical protein